MENSKEYLHELTESDIRNISGGVGLGTALLVGFAASAIFHVAKEIYNDWDAHVEAFKEGMEAAE